jgi:hypothetical protein
MEMIFMSLAINTMLKIDIFISIVLRIRLGQFYFKNYKNQN